MFAEPKVTQSGTSLHVEHGNDSNLYVEFTMESIHQPFASEQEGRPIYKDVPHIRIMFPGDKTKAVYRPVSEEDQFRFPKHWAAFKNQEQHVADGTPITEWPPLSRSEAMEFKAMNIHTVEALASLPDSALTWLGGRTRRDQAKAFLEVAKDNSVTIKMQSELSKRDADIDALKQQIAALSARNSNDDETQKRGKTAKGD